jgi:hypothetical protein
VSLCHDPNGVRFFDIVCSKLTGALVLHTYAFFAFQKQVCFAYALDMQNDEVTTSAEPPLLPVALNLRHDSLERSAIIKPTLLA